MISWTVIFPITPKHIHHQLQDSLYFNCLIQVRMKNFWSNLRCWHLQCSNITLDINKLDKTVISELTWLHFKVLEGEESSLNLCLIKSWREKLTRNVRLLKLGIKNFWQLFLSLCHTRTVVLNQGTTLPLKSSDSFHMCSKTIFSHWLWKLWFSTKVPRYSLRVPTVFKFWLLRLFFPFGVTLIIQKEYWKTNKPVWDRFHDSSRVDYALKQGWSSVFGLCTFFVSRGYFNAKKNGLRAVCCPLLF